MRICMNIIAANENLYEYCSSQWESVWILLQPMRICTNIVAANEPGRLPNQYEILHFIVFVNSHRHNILQTCSWEGSLVPRCGFASPGYAAWGHACSAAGPATQAQVYNLKSRQFMTRLKVLSHQICWALLACLNSVRGHSVRYAWWMISVWALYRTFRYQIEGESVRFKRESVRYYTGYGSKLFLRCSIWAAAQSSQ
jgi:hypothetical protein